MLKFLTNKELKYLLNIIGISVLFVFLYITLFTKYIQVTISHLLRHCGVISGPFLSINSFNHYLHYIGYILIVVLLLTEAIFFIKILFSYIKTWIWSRILLSRRILRTPDKLESILSKNSISKDLFTVVDVDKNVALTLGWFSPKIVLSDKLIFRLSPRELEAVVLHEYYHLKGRHPFLIVICEILSSTFLLLPILKDLTKKLRSIMEKEADKYVLNRQKTPQYLNLALDKISSEEMFNVYSTLSFLSLIGDKIEGSRRKEYNIRRSSIIFLILFILIWILLFSTPFSLENQKDGFLVERNHHLELSNCGENQCLEDCLSVRFSIFDSIKKVVFENYIS